MPTFNWEEMASQFGGNFKDYAPDGVYTVKFASASIRKASTGTNWLELKPADDNYAYPKISHPLSSKNVNWRAWHMRSIFMELGADESSAKKAVESCEGKSSEDNIAAAYLNAVERLIAKKNDVNIEVWQDGKYKRADFDSGVRMNRPGDEAPKITNAAVSDIFGDDVEEIKDDSNVPF